MLDSTGVRGWGGGDMTTPRILIATPVDGSPETAVVTHGYHHAVRQLERSGAVVMPSTLSFSDDLARARSRAVWWALQADSWDYVLFWDDDVCPADTQIVPRMIARAEEDGYDVIGAPYPRKRIPAQFPYRPLPASLGQGSLDVVRDCVEVEALAFGFMLTSRKCLKSMVEYYKDDWFTDNHDQYRPHNTVAIFRQVMTDTSVLPDGTLTRDLLSEDYSFCHRWRAMGGKVMMYVGEGAPLRHIGGYAYHGERQDLGRVR